MKVTDFDIVYISYDEPNAEENFLDLQAKFPDAKRVHGVKGFDASHRRAAEIAKTDYLFIIDGDNKVCPEFFLQEIGELKPDCVYSWGSKNIINHLIYGNGGIKLWPKKLLLSVDCHDTGEGNDWCHKIKYLQMNDWYSYSYCNGSPFQAFRSGFREGVKLCLDESGERFPRLDLDITRIFEGNLRRLITWMSVGLDTVNGIYAMYGARLGFLKATCEVDFDINIISNYEKLKDYWDNELHYVGEGNYLEHFKSMALDIRRITGLPVCDLDVHQSECLKRLMFNPARDGLMKTLVSEDDQAIRQNYKYKEV